MLAADKLDFGRGVLAQARRKMAVVEFKPLYERQIPKWIAARVQRGGGRITPEAAELLLANVGTDPGDLANELEKLLIFVDKRPLIEVKDVERAAGFSRISNVFELTDALGAKEVGRAIFLLDRLLDRGETPNGLLYMIARHFTILLKITELEEEHLPRTQLAREVGVHPYFLKRYIAQTRNFDRASLTRSLDVLLEADSRLKSGHRNARIVLELLIYTLGH